MKQKRITIEELARMIKKGFDGTATKVGTATKEDVADLRKQIGVVDQKVDLVDQKVGLVDQKVDLLVTVLHNKEVVNSEDVAPIKKIKVFPHKSMPAV